jgi:hypothetical protein
MARNLINLIKSSGGAGISGQTFRLNAARDTTGPNSGLPLADGVKVTDYLVNSLVGIGWPPSNDPGTNPVGDSNNDAQTLVLPTLTLTVNRNSRAYLIQRTDPGAWVLSASVEQGYGMGNAAPLTVHNLSTSDEGGTFLLDVELTPSIRGIPFFGINRIDLEGTSDFYWGLTAQTGGTVGDFSIIRVYMIYNPDTQVFNNPLFLPDPTNPNLDGIAIKVYDRKYTLSDFNFRWYTQADADPNNPANPYTPVSTASTYLVSNAIPGQTYTARPWYQFAAGGLSWVAATTVQSYTVPTGGGGGPEDPE